MVFIVKRQGETKDSMFRKFSRSFMEEDIVNEMRKRLFYRKPSLKRKEEEKERRAKRSKFKKVFKRGAFGTFNRLRVKK